MKEKTLTEAEPFLLKHSKNSRFLLANQKITRALAKTLKMVTCQHYVRASRVRLPLTENARALGTRLHIA